MAAMVLANVASEMLFALLAVYLGRLGASAAQIGLTFTLASIVPLVLQIFGGWLSDSIGRLRAIAIGALGGSLGYIGMALAPTWQWAALALALEYISGSLVGPSFGAYIADQSAEDERGRAFGLVKGIFLVVAVIGPWLGGLLADRFGFKVMLNTAAVMYVSAALLRVWMALAPRFSEGKRAELPPLRTLPASLRTIGGLILAGGLVTWIFVTDGVRDTAYSLSGELLPLYFERVGGLSAAQIGQVVALRGAAMMLVALPAGWLSDRRGERVTILAGFAVQFAALVFLLLARSPWSYAAANLLLGIGFGLVIPAYDSLISKAVPGKMRGVAFGLFWTSLGLISLPAPWLGGQLWERLGPRVPFAITAVALLLAMLPVWRKFRLTETPSDADKRGSNRNSRCSHKEAP